MRQTLDTNPPSFSSLWPGDLQMHGWYHLKPFHSVTKSWPWVLSFVHGSSRPILSHCSCFKAFLFVPLPCTQPLALCLSRTWEYNTLCLPSPLLCPPHVTALIWPSHGRRQATMMNLNPTSSAWQLYMYEALTSSPFLLWRPHDRKGSVTSEYGLLSLQGQASPSAPLNT